MDALSDADRRRLEQLHALMRKDLDTLYEIDRKQAIETRPLDRRQLRRQAERVLSYYGDYYEEYTTLLRKEIPTQFTPGEQALIHMVVQQLNSDQVAVTHTALQRAGCAPDDPTFAQLSAKVVAALPSVQQHLTATNTPVAHHIAQAAQILHAPTADRKQKLRLSILLIPLILSYETEFNLNINANLKEAWEELIQRFPPSFLSSGESAVTSLSQSSGPTDEPFALVMKGGGVKGLAYIGALKELEKYYRFEWFIGTSAGAIAAVLLAAGYTTGELEFLFSEKDFREFLDAKPYKWFTNLVFRKGLFPAYMLTTWIDQLLAKKLDSPVRVTLGQLPCRATVYASRRGRNALVFDSHDPRTRDTPAAYAVRCSMAIPFVFTPQMDAGMRVLDGGMRNNYPVDILLRDHPSAQFIGLYLGPEYFEGPKREGWLISDLLAIWTEATDIEALEKYLENTVIIDTRPISTVNFSLTKEEKDFLLKVGRLGALKFLLKQTY